MKLIDIKGADSVLPGKRKKKGCDNILQAKDRKEADEAIINDISKGFNQAVASLETISIVMDAEKMAKETYEIYSYPDHPTLWEELIEIDRRIWITRTKILIDNAQKFIRLEKIK